MSILELLVCFKCNSSEIDFSNVVKVNNNFEGTIRCTECESRMSFENGILNILAKESITLNEKRNKDAYSDFWKRAKEDVQNDEVTEEMSLIRSWGEHLRGGSFVDVGCGNGRHMPVWIENGYKRMVFIDISDAIEDCKILFEKLKKGTEEAIFIRGSLASVPLVSNSMDIVWSSGVLGLVNDQSSALGEMFRVCRSRLSLGVLTDKTFVGRVYIAANIVKPLINKVNNFSFLYWLTGFLAHVMFVVFKLMLLFRVKGFLSNDFIRRVSSRREFVSRIQWGMYDPVIIPRVVKHPDEFYINIAKSNSFSINYQTTKIICDYYFFYKDMERL